jgi:hypothetical protein
LRIFDIFSIGLTSIEDGVVSESMMKLESSNISRMPFAKDPQVVKSVREFNLNENGKLTQIYFMATSKTPLTKHLEATYTKM